MTKIEITQSGALKELTSLFSSPFFAYPVVAASLILHANILIKIIESRKAS